MTLVRKSNHPFYSVMNDFFNEDVEKFFGNKSNKPLVNVTENDKEFKLELVAPGLKRDDFKVNIDNDMLNISSEIEHSSEEKDDNKVLRREYSYSSFSRSFTLPENVDAENIAAKYEDGVLKLNLPKKAIEAPKVKEISIS